MGKIFLGKNCFIENAIETNIGLTELVRSLSMMECIEYALNFYILNLKHMKQIKGF